MKPRALRQAVHRAGACLAALASFVYRRGRLAACPDIGNGPAPAIAEAARAHALAAELPVTFDVGSVSALPYDPGTFDLVLCNHLLNDLEDPAQAIREFARVLTEEGRIIILMLHPCFYNKHAERDEPGNNLLTATYFQARDVTQNFEVDGLQSPAANTTWIRPLEYYAKALQESGFAITGLSEPHPSEQLLRSDDWWRTSFTRPLFILMVAQRWSRSPGSGEP